jgi:nitrite reductase/ring-hydroxylating ferredoxin subunit
MEHAQSLESAGEAAAVRAALDAGRLTVPDPKSGFQHSMYATCPHDGTHVLARRIVREARGSITQVTAKCPQCGAEFNATPEELHLR